MTTSMTPHDAIVSALQQAWETEGCYGVEPDEHEWVADLVLSHLALAGVRDGEPLMAIAEGTPLSIEEQRAGPLAGALADAMKRWDDEGDDDVTYQESYENGWSLAEFIALALVRDGWTFTPPEPTTSAHPETPVSDRAQGQQ